MNNVISKFLVFAVWLALYGCSPNENKKAVSDVYYTCSMHPQIRMEENGKCPICGMGLTKVQMNHDHGAHASNDEGESYYCASDPSVTSEVPGECPLDGEPMQKMQKHAALETIRLRKNQVDHFRAKLSEVTLARMSKNVRVLGKAMKAADKESNIPARVEGRVEEVFVESSGRLIKQGDPVLMLYSPRLLSGADEYLISRKNYLADKSSREFKEIFERSVQRLKLWGIQEEQLKRWAHEGKAPRAITIYSPVTGIVEKKNAIKGKYFNEGQSFFDLVDLSSLWVELDIYEHESARVKDGQEVELEFSAYPGEIWKGKIDFISPVLNEQSRTLKARITLENPKGKLRPGMVAMGLLKVELEREVLAIERSSIIDTGKRKVVWVSVGNDVYEAREVMTGFESEGLVEIKQGLTIGELVVEDGNFLLDAQARLFGDLQEDASGHEHQH